MGTEARDLLEGQLRAGGDDEIVVVNRAAVIELELVVVRVQALDADAGKLDAVFVHDLGQIDLDLLGLAPADGDPGIGRRELEIVGVPDQRDVMGSAEFSAEFENL